MILSNWLDSQVSKVIQVRGLCFVGSLFLRVKIDTNKGFWYSGGKGVPQVCGRDILGYQSTACLQTGTMAIVSQCFFLESLWGKKSWVLQSGPQFCKKKKIGPRKEWQIVQHHCPNQGDARRVRWTLRVFTEYFNSSESYILHSSVRLNYSCHGPGPPFN